MYQFTDTNERARGAFSPSDNMRVNQDYIDQQIDGYRQLHVSGRSLIGQEVSHTKVPGRPGVIVHNVQDDYREIEVTYQLQAKTSTQLRDKFAQLNALLRGKLTLNFDDEPHYTYTAYLSKVAEVSEQSLTIVSSFTLVVPNPYKEQDTQASTGVIRLRDAVEVLPQRVIVQTIRNTETVEIVNRDKRIKLEGNFLANQLIKIEWTDRTVRITYQNRNILSSLAKLFAPEVFFLRNGDTVTAVNARVVRVEWRDRRL